MMSAKTVLTEAPVTAPMPAVANNAASGSPGGAPSDFQSLLTGAVLPALAPAEAETLPAPPLVQLLDLKQQMAAKLPGAAPVVLPVQPALPAVVSRADLLKFHSESVALAVEAGEAVDDFDSALPDTESGELLDSEEATAAEASALSEWLDAMVPLSVFAPQAGSKAPDTAIEEGEGRLPASAVSIPVSLVQQAGLPERNENMDSPAPPSTPAQGAGAVLAIHRDATATAAQNVATAFTAALVGKPDGSETESETGKPATESWMNALGDLTTRRTSDTAPVLEARLPVPVQDPRWADAIAHRLVMMARDGESVASLKLVPVDLGPLDIKISVKDGEANVHFGAAHQETRAVLEASMPRLRELLSAQGLQLANASVSHQSSGQNRPERSASTGVVNAIGEETEVTAAKVLSTSLLDIYA